MFAFHWIRYWLLGMIHVTSKKHDCIETHPAGDIDTVTSTTMPFSSNPPEETSITQSSSSNALEERSTTTTPFSSNALEEPSTTTLSSSKAALVEVKAEIDTEKCKGTVKIEKKKKRKKKKKKRNKKNAWAVVMIHLMANECTKMLGTMSTKNCAEMWEICRKKTGADGLGWDELGDCSLWFLFKILLKINR